jgi:hypothetical protein
MCTLRALIMSLARCASSGGTQPAGFQPGAGSRYDKAAASITTK